MKLGRIDYLNCYPFYYHMLERKPLPDVDLYPRLPSELNRLMTEGGLDLSPVSAAAYADLAGSAVLLPEFCIGSKGPVGSVILISKVPIERLDGRTLALTSASRTSVTLLKIILKKFYCAEPEYVQSGPAPSLKKYDAAVVIGDHAMTPEADNAPYRYDLGELWLEKTGRPVVFAVFAAGKAAVAADPEGIKAAAGSYKASLRCLAEERRALVAAAERAYPSVTCDVDAYFSGLRYDFTDEMQDALRFYLSAGAKLGLLKEVKELEFLKP